MRAHKHVTYEEKPIEEFLKEERAKEALKERDIESAGIKKMIKKGIKEKFPVAKEKSGLVRTLSDEEVFEMNQKEMAEKMLKSHIEINCDARSKPKLERLLRYVADCVCRNGYFSPSEHVKKDVDTFVSYMGDAINVKTKFPYYTATMYADLRKLEELEKIYSKGSKNNVVYYLGKKEKKQAGTTTIEQPQVTSAQYDPISQKIYIDIVVRVHTETV